MSQLRCKACNWAQDEFWSDDYSPLDELKTDHLKELLVKGDFTIIERWIADEMGMGYELRNNLCYVPWREYVISVLLEAENKVKNMRFRTEAEWKVYKTTTGNKCPVCGADALTTEV